MEPLLPPSERDWWYDTTYPQYAEDALLKSRYYTDYRDDPYVLDYISENIDPILNENAYNELVEGSSTVSKDTWVTGLDTGEYNNLRRSSDSVVFLNNKRDIPLEEIVTNEIADSEFIENMEQTVLTIPPSEDTVSPRRTRTNGTISPRSNGMNNTVRSRSNGTVNEPTDIDDETVVDSRLLGISPVNLQGRSMSPRRSSWIIHDGTVFSPTLSNAGLNDDNVVANLGNNQRDYERDSTSIRYIAVDDSIATGEEDMDSIVRLIDTMGDRITDRIVDYNGQSQTDSTVISNSLYLDDDDGQVEIIYKQVNQDLLND